MIQDISQKEEFLNNLRDEILVLQKLGVDEGEIKFLLNQKRKREDLKSEE